MIEAVHDELVRSGALAPIALGGPDEVRWSDCDLASLAENRLDDPTDPRALDAARRATWKKRATEERLWTPTARSRYERCYWIIEDGKEAGTLALGIQSLGRASIDVASFYVMPDRRGHGVGRRTLERVRGAAAPRGLGIRLDTSWCWQKAVRFYLNAGMWVYMWKRDLTLWAGPTTASPLIDVGDTEATLSVPLGGSNVVIARAERRGDALVLDDPIPAMAREPALGEAYWHAGSTLALALALRGWPLVRSIERWEDSYFADAGAPESLAYKITLWEAWYRKHGWSVQTPRIPGLEYPTWEQFEARWDRELAAIEQRAAEEKAKAGGQDP